MIGHLRGKVLSLSPGEVLLDVDGVGYELRTSLQTFYALAERRGGEAALQVHTHVREGAIELFGFRDAQERDMFRHLVAVSGVGPKVALAILSGIEAGELREAVGDGDRDRLQRIPGVGKKTADRVLLELTDRLRRAERAARPSGRQPAAVESGRPTTRGDAVSALVNLGYGEAVARKAVDAEIDDDKTGTGRSLEDVLRGALRRLVR